MMNLVALLAVLSVMMAIFYICTFQYCSHQLPVATKPLKCC